MGFIEFIISFLKDPRTQIAAWIATLGPVLVYCRSGYRSNIAAHKLADFGYETVYDIGGLVGWPYGLV